MTNAIRIAAVILTYVLVAFLSGCAGTSTDPPAKYIVAEDKYRFNVVDFETERRLSLRLPSVDMIMHIAIMGVPIVTRAATRATALEYLERYRPGCSLTGDGVSNGIDAIDWRYECPAAIRR
jgi:hypothetical protein